MDFARAGDKVKSIRRWGEAVLVLLHGLGRRRSEAIFCAGLRDEAIFERDGFDGAEVITDANNVRPVVV